MTIPQTNAAIKKLARALDPAKGTFVLNPMKILEKKIKERVFVKGLSTAGEERPYFSAKWVAIRKERGRQVEKVDLFYQGTGKADEHSTPPSLYRTIKTAKEGSAVQMGVDNDFNYFQKLGQEEGYRGDILQPSDSEIEYLMNTIQSEVNALIEDIFAQ